MCAAGRHMLMHQHLSLTWPREMPWFLFLCLFCLQLILQLSLISPSIPPFELSALSLLFSLSPFHSPESVISNYSTVPTQILFGEEYYACDECECVHRIIFFFCLPLCVWISSYPLIRMTVSINSLGLMCKSVTLAFLRARLLCSLVTPGPNYRADDLTSDH